MALLLGGLFTGKDCFEMMKQCSLKTAHPDSWCQFILTRWQSESSAPGFTCGGFVSGLNAYGNVQQAAIQAMTRPPPPRPPPAGAGRRNLLVNPSPPSPPPLPRPPAPPPPPNNFIASNIYLYQMRLAECPVVTEVMDGARKCVMIDYDRNVNLVIAGSCIGFASFFILIYFFACSQKPPPTDDELKRIILLRARQDLPWRHKGWQHTRPPKEA